jgi:hypothetical protein
MQKVLRIAVVWGTLLLVSTAWAQETNKVDSLIIDKVEMEKGGKAAVKIYLVNSQELAGLTIPLGLAGKGVKIDSLSFSGSRVEYIKMKPVTVAKDQKQVVFGAITMTEDYLPAGRGLMATLFVSADSAFAGKCSIDTTTIGPASVLYTKKDSYNYVPNFSSGSISLKDPSKKTK